LIVEVTLEPESGIVALMKKRLYLFACLLLPLCPLADAQSQKSWSSEQSQVIAAMHRLSATTAPDGNGADDYADVLAENFSRWTTGSSVINHKKEWVEGVRDWFDDGWRVIDRQQKVLDVTIRADEAFTRRIVEETYLGPDGEKTVSKAGLAETWIRAEGSWLLLRVNVDVLDSQ
jgi:hypothetical protein